MKESKEKTPGVQEIIAYIMKSTKVQTLGVYRV